MTGGEVTLGEIARSLNEVKAQLVRDANAAAAREAAQLERMDLYVLTKVYDAEMKRQQDKNAAMQGEIDELWRKRDEDAKARETKAQADAKQREDDLKSKRALLVTVGLAVLGDIVALIVGFMAVLLK